MPVAQNKKSKARRNNRRSHIHLAVPTLQKCPNCQEPKRPHRVCRHCGHYKGAAVVRQPEAKV